MNNKIKIAAIAVVTALVVVLLGAIIKHSASANYDNEEPCVPSEAWTETIEHEAVYETVHHEAETHTEYHFAKFTRTKYKKPFKDWGDFGPWTKWSPETHTSWELSTTPLGSPQFHGEGWDGLTKWYREWQAMHDGQTREVVDQEAYDEEVLVEEAWTETIEHPAVECPEEPTDPTCPPNEPQRPTLDPCDEPTDPPTDPCEPVVTESGHSFYPCDPTFPGDPEEPTEPESESEIGDSISAKRVCIDFDEVKITHFINGVEDHVTFAPARPSDKCGSPSLGDRTVPSSLPERYAPEEGM